jgi:hypothetical protein
MPERRITATLDARPRIAVDATLCAIDSPCFRKDAVGNVVGVNAERALIILAANSPKWEAPVGLWLELAASRSREDLHIEGSAG